MVSPTTVQVVPVVEQVKPPGFEVAVYELMAAPPLEAGAVQATVTEPLPAVTELTVGAPGTVRGVTAAEGAEAGPVPTALVAVTVNV